MKCQSCILIFLQWIAFLFSFSSCNGQSKTSPSPGRLIQTQNLPRLIRSQGIITRNVICEIQDRKGNLWFSTNGEGVYRYDGEFFVNFTETDGLCSNDVNEIIEDHNGNILFGTHQGICQYDGESFAPYPIADSLIRSKITCLLEDRDHHLWFGTMTDGVYRFDGQSTTGYLSDQLILDMLQDQHGNIWFSSWNRGGVWKYDGQTFHNYIPSDDMVFSMTEDTKGNIWFATRRHGACRYDGRSFTSFGENEGFVSYGIYSIAEDKKGNIWLTTDKNGVWKYDGRTFLNFTTNDGLVNNSVFSVLEDKRGNLWFGTRAFGLSRYDGHAFRTFSQ